MSTHAQYRAAVAKIEALRAKHEHERHQAEAELQAALPFLGDDIFVLIAAELDARMLGRLACTAQRFWRPSVPDPAHKGSAPPELWSVAEEGARRRLAAQSEQVRGWVSRGAGVGGSWLRALGEAEKLQRPLRFTDHGVGVLLGEEGALAMGNNYKSAVCGEHEMRRGQHYATFTLRSNADAMVGVAGVDFDCASLEPGPLGWAGSAYDSPFGWAVGTEDSELSAWHNGSEVRWEGQPQVTDGAEPLKEGDVVGLLLDLDAATLTLWVNGEHKGVAIRPGTTDVNGEPVPRLKGPLRWAVDLFDTSVAIASGPLPPPS